MSNDGRESAFDGLSGEAYGEEAYDLADGISEDNMVGNAEEREVALKKARLRRIVSSAWQITSRLLELEKLIPDMQAGDLTWLVVQHEIVSDWRTESH
jgi:hypothetical protein